MPECLPDLLPPLQSHHHGLQKEACWVLSNIAGMPGRGGIEALKAAGAVPVRGGDRKAGSRPAATVMAQQVPEKPLLPFPFCFFPSSSWCYSPQALMCLLKDAPFHVRKEAAFALANICADGGGGTGALSC